MTIVDLYARCCGFVKAIDALLAAQREEIAKRLDQELVEAHRAADDAQKDGDGSGRVEGALARVLALARAVQLVRGES